MDPANVEGNPLFDELAGKPDDIEGLVAYALYKRHKRRWAEDFRGRLKREPTTAEEIDFAHAAMTSDQLDRYRKDAQDMLIAFASGLVDEERPNIIEGALAGRAGDVLSKIEASARLRNIIVTSVASTIVTTLLLSFLAFGVRIFGLDLTDAVTIEKPTAANPESGEERLP